MKNDLENEVNKKKIRNIIPPRDSNTRPMASYAIKPEHLAHWAMLVVGDISLKVQYKLANVRYTPARA